MILLAVAVTGVLNLGLWSAHVRVPACEKELGRPFITCRAVLRTPGGGARCPGLRVFTTWFLRRWRGGGLGRSWLPCPGMKGDCRSWSASRWELSLPVLLHPSLDPGPCPPEHICSVEEETLSGFLEWKPSAECSL